MNYFSARLQVICLVDDDARPSEYTCDYPFILFRASGFDDAFKKALVLGRERETTYKNDAGNDVRWALAQVEEIWDLGIDIDGIEIGSIMDVLKPEKAIPYDFDFKPDENVPIYSDKP